MNEHEQVVEVAIRHPWSTPIFQRHGIEFRDAGSGSLAEACQIAGAELATVIYELDAELESKDRFAARWSNRPISDLIKYILARFHCPLYRELPRLERLLHDLVATYGDAAPESLLALSAVYMELQSDLEQHMYKEERVLFPLFLNYCGELVQGPTTIIEREHKRAVDLLRRIREITEDYTVPEGVDGAWSAVWEGLEQLERELHLHIHLENNILHPLARSRRPLV